MPSRFGYGFTTPRLKTAASQFFMAESLVMKRFAIIFVLLFTLPLAAQELTPPVIDIAATQLGFTPNHVTVRRGDIVTLRFSTQERGQRVDQKDLRIHLRLTPDHTSEVTITAPRQGRFIATSGLAQGDAGLVIDVTE